jgi:hypothetical protein
MAGASFSIKLRCASWQQLATIYRRDLSRGTMFLKASTQPPLGTIVRIDLELPSASVIELQGTISEHLTDPQRGTGVNLKLEPLPTKSVWMIESALAAENKVRAATGSDTSQAGAMPQQPARASTITDGEDIAAAELELISALEAEAESLRKLNPFLVLGVGYETTDADVRAAFGELTKRYHPDRFARYQSAKLRQIAAEIFILIRDAYRRLADEKSRQQVIATLGPKIPARAQTQPRAAPPAAIPPTPPRPSANMRVAVPPAPPPKATTNDTPTVQSPHDAPTNQSGKPAELAGTELAKPDQLAIPVEHAQTARAPQRTPAQGIPQSGQAQKTPAHGVPTDKLPQRGSGRMATASDGGEMGSLEALLDDGKFDEALAGYRVLLKKQPQDKAVRAGIELGEGMKALAARDRMEAAQRFEAALELDPSNERAARELAEMRRHATNERKGLLSRLMGKKEPPP